MQLREPCACRASKLLGQSFWGVGPRTLPAFFPFQCASIVLLGLMGILLAGATTYPGFQKYVVESCETRVYTLLHIALHGLASAGCAGIGLCFYFFAGGYTAHAEFFFCLSQFQIIMKASLCVWQSCDNALARNVGISCWVCRKAT